MSATSDLRNIEHALKVLAITCGCFALVHCAAPNLPDDGDVGGDGRAESGSPGDKAAAAPASHAAPSTPPAAPAGTSATSPTAPTSPTATCTKSLPFAAPSLAPGLATSTDSATPRLSHDELTLYFTTHVNGVARPARVTRTSLTTPFGATQLVDVQSTTAKDNDPSISADGSTLWFSSERNGSQDRLFFAPLVPGTTTFGTPQLATGIAGSADDEHPYFRVAGGGELWFSSSRSGQWDIYVAKKNATGSFDAPARVDELHAPEASRQPMITEDGLTILFASERAGGAGGRDLWIATRATTVGPFDPPQVVANVSSPANEFAGWLSADGCRIYFSSDRAVAGQHQIYVASRP